MCKTVLLEWTFDPKNYFESNIEIVHQTAKLTISEGRACAEIPYEEYKANANYKRDLNELLENRFLAVQVLTHTPYKLTKPIRIVLNEDGKKVNHVIEFDTMALEEPHFGEVDFKIIDKDGNIKIDSKEDRRKLKTTISDKVTKHAPENSVLRFLLRSYDNAVNDPENELVHLYDIRDAITSHFEGKDNAVSKLSISSSKWDRLGVICCNEPFLQGRHRGKHIDELRHANKEALEEARSIARELIQAYISVL